MSSLRSFFLLLCLLPAGCGFTPMHGKSGPASQVVEAGIMVEGPDDSRGMQLKHQLEDRLNPGGHVRPNPAYKIIVTLQANSTAIGVARDGTVSRYNVTLSSGYQLIALADNRVIKSGQIQHVSSYNNQANQYFSTYVSEKDAIARGITELAELYGQRIGVLVTKGVVK